MNQRLVIWIIGLPNAGKTAVACELKSLLDVAHQPAVVLDGDDMRQVLAMQNSHYDRRSRVENALRIGRLAKLLSSQGSIVIVAANTLLKEVQRHHRQALQGYFEIFLAADEATRRSRDGRKRLYQRYDRKEIDSVLGLDLPADIPESPDLRIDVSSGGPDPRQAARMIFTALNSRDRLGDAAPPTQPPSCGAVHA